MIAVDLGRAVIGGGLALSGFLGWSSVVLADRRARRADPVLRAADAERVHFHGR